jgi:hypothetical protein
MGKFSSERSRLWVLGIALTLMAAAAVVQLVGRRLGRDAWKLNEKIVRTERNALDNITGLRVYLARNQSPDPVRVEERLRDCRAEVSEALRLYHKFDRSVGARELQHELEEADKLAATLDAALPDKTPEDINNIILQITARLEVLEQDLLDAGGAALAVLDQQAQASHAWQQAALMITLAAFLTLLPGVVVQIGQLLVGTAEPVDIKRELAKLETSKIFQGRMELLRPNPASNAPPWKLTLVNIRSKRKSHTVFEAEAQSGDDRVLLWGKRYGWTGFIKSFQRLFFSAYDSATWNILCAMHNAGMTSPVPVIWERIRTRNMPVGSIILAEHIGQVEQVQKFIRSRFGLLSPERRVEILKALADFVNQLHALNIYGLSPRYFCAAGLNEGAEVTLYLFDLDKAGLLRKAPNFVKRFFTARDIRRLKDLLINYTPPAERKVFDQHLAQGNNPPMAS